MSQSQAVLFWLKQGNSLSQAEAISKFGCYRLGARIYDLRKSGAKIETQMVERLNRNGNVVRFAVYTLEKNGRKKKTA